MNRQREIALDRITDRRYFGRVIQNVRHLYLENRAGAQIHFSLSSDPSAPDYRIIAPDGYILDCAGREGQRADLSVLAERAFTLAEIWYIHRAMRRNVGRQ